MLKETRFIYDVFGIVVASEFEIKELRPCENPRKIDLIIRIKDLGLMGENASQQFSFNEERQTIVLPFVGAFVLEGLSTLWVEPKPGVNPDLLAMPILGPVLAILLHMKGYFVLHGSAVMCDGKAYGFLGDKGAGKSTLAAMLLKNEGVQLITDDLLVVSHHLQVLQGYPQVKLTDEALSHSDQRLGIVRPKPVKEFPKNQFLFDWRAKIEPCPIGGIFELKRSGATKIERLPFVESVQILLRYSYISRFVTRDMALAEKQRLFEVVSSLAASGNVKRIFVPDQIQKLDDVMDDLIAGEA